MQALFRKLCGLLMLIGGLGVLALMVNVTADVVSKFVWNAPIQGTIEVSSYYYMVALVMLPMAFVELEDEQISVDLLFNHFPGPLQRVSLVLTCLATTGILWTMAWRTGLDALRAWNIGEVVMGSREIIVWPGRMMLPLGFTLAGLAALVRLVMVLRGENIVKNAEEAPSA
ncbi:TRAP transporter small permease subunit [Tranquillimonas alkanivorans]|uniref:TRAP transporter small permease protein n=1 Tax=Tranquillimonas alkanivorans TaxID=441119 RepID=A0A1I5T5U0_9RHOB|nr:TRAP transporter small permease [Tranquillimonas alkanivorans]SFP78328.1 TRAP-type mannitol/chloroaromatic compound transport system, small permease component [Tranquillimonas alkanivorans]